MSSFSHPTVVVEEETNLEAVHFKLKWSIHNFESLKNRNDDVYSSGITMAELGMEEGFRGRWRTCVTPCFASFGTMNHVCVFLCLTNEHEQSTLYTEDQAFSCAFRLGVTSGALMDVPIFAPSEFTNVHKYSFGKSKWGRNVISHQGLFGSDNTVGCLKDSSLHIVMDVVVYKEPKTVREVATSLLQRYQGFLGLQQKQQEVGGDFLLVSNNNKEFHVDRCLLMAHSPVFAAMLNHNTKEKQTSRCKMEDIDGECVEILLNYVSGCDTGKIQGNNAEKVLMMADKYQIMDLRAVCERTLANAMTVHNAVEVLLLARQLSLGTLKDVAKKFIRTNFLATSTFCRIRKNMDLKAILDESF